MITLSRVAGLAFSRCASNSPLMNGSTRSSTIKRGAKRPMCSSASSALEAVCTSAPSPASTMLTSLALAGSSSTTSTHSPARGPRSRDTRELASACAVSAPPVVTARSGRCASEQGFVGTRAVLRSECQHRRRPTSARDGSHAARNWPAAKRGTRRLLWSTRQNCGSHTMVWGAACQACW
jgi:hypothetical protein